ncbi:MAG: hypothetical protein U1E34_09090 [Amaricoccus sp.]
MKSFKKPGRTDARKAENSRLAVREDRGILVARRRPWHGFDAEDRPDREIQV